MTEFQFLGELFLLNKTQPQNKFSYFKKNLHLMIKIYLSTVFASEMTCFHFETIHGCKSSVLF